MNYNATYLFFHVQPTSCFLYCIFQSPVIISKKPLISVWSEIKHHVENRNMLTKSNPSHLTSCLVSCLKMLRYYWATMQTQVWKEFLYGAFVCGDWVSSLLPNSSLFYVRIHPTKIITWVSAVISWRYSFCLRSCTAARTIEVGALYQPCLFLNQCQLSTSLPWNIKGRRIRKQHVAPKASIFHSLVLSFVWILRQSEQKPCIDSSPVSQRTALIYLFTLPFLLHFCAVIFYYHDEAVCNSAL